MQRVPDIPPCCALPPAPLMNTAHMPAEGYGFGYGCGSPARGAPPGDTLPQPDLYIAAPCAAHGPRRSQQHTRMPQPCGCHRHAQSCTIHRTCQGCAQGWPAFAPMPQVHYRHAVAHGVSAHAAAGVPPSPSTGAPCAAPGVVYLSAPNTHPRRKLPTPGPPEA